MRSKRDPPPGAEGIFSSQEATSIRARLVKWYRAHGRDLPWRRTHDPYAIMVSEFMLQQTQVVSVIPYFECWMRQFPNFRALAAASEQEVLAAWQGLGYYARARALHGAAQAVVEQYGGELPRDREALRALPGVGDYTAAAVVAFAWDQPVPVVDANIARVLARLCDRRERIDTAEGRRFLNAAAEKLQPRRRGGRELNSALMELGALVCRPTKPVCAECPVRSACRAEVPSALPFKVPRARVIATRERVALALANGTVFLTPSTGPRWKGMYLLPPLPARTQAARRVHRLVYPITRYRVTLDVFQVPEPPADTVPIPVSELETTPMPTPHRRALQAATKKL